MSDEPEADEVPAFSNDLGEPEHEEIYGTAVLSSAEYDLIVGHRNGLRLQAECDAADRARAIATVDYLNDHIWKTANGTLMTMSKMTPHHADNSYRMVQRNWPTDPRRVFPLRPMVAYDLLGGTVPLSFEHTTLGAALKSRSRERTTWRERRRDARSLTQWEKRQADTEARREELRELWLDAWEE